jgi:arylsulfatase A-like enzyme
VEFVDIYPSLCEVAGLSYPASHPLEGKSFAPLLHNPNQPWKQAVFSQWKTAKAVKTDRYLYTEWSSGSKMLFDHLSDPQENINIADKRELADTVTHLSSLLKTS